MGEWTHNNNIVYDEDGLAFADCRYQKGRAKQICREHNAHEGLMQVAKFVRSHHPEIEAIDDINLDCLIAEAEGKQ